jgi:hypothetical protein
MIPMLRVVLAAVLGLASASPIAHTAAASLQGVVQSGGTGSTRPLPGVKVRLFEATATDPVALGHATTDASGRFVLPSPKDVSQSVFYATATVARGVEFVTVLGPSLPPVATLNELTTVAAGYAMAQFTDADGISGEAFALQVAAGMNDNLVDPETGTASPVLLASPNGDETISLRTTRALANLLAACVESRGVTGSFLALTKPARGAPPRSTALALALLARDPGRNVSQIDRLTRLARTYLPALERVPDAWTVAVKVNDSGDDSIRFGGPGNLAFDARGFAWVTNNVVQGDTVSSHAIMALQPNGRPADGLNGAPPSPITGGGILGTGFGIGVDPQGSVWVGNFGWGGVNPSPTGNGSVSQFSPSGAPISGPLGYQGGPVRAQGTVSDAHGNIWIASFGDDSLYVFPGGNPDDSVSFHQYHGSQPFDIAIAPDGAAWVSNSGGLSGEFPSSVARFVLEDGKLTRPLLRFVGQSLKGLAVDSAGNAWVASLDDDSVYGVRPDGTVMGPFTGGGIVGPWGVTTDGDDNLWVANFGPMGVTNDFPDGRLSKLCGIRRAACPPRARLGDPLSPASGYTMPSGGSEVLLHDGEPLYGPGAPPSFAPMMRQTTSVIDLAGNVWTINNWKPDFAVDLTVNPGGDGILIFVGLAPPPPPLPGLGPG